MDLHYSVQTNMQMSTDSNLTEYADIDEDDAFYVELRRQILLLTADDDEDFRRTRYRSSISATKQGSISLTTSFPIAPNETASSVPTGLVNLRRNGNGTGVFIPHTVTIYRPAEPPGRRYNERRRIYKQVENK